MPAETETGVQPSTSIEVADPRDLAYSQRQHRMMRLLRSARLGLTGVAFLSGISILATSANALMVYNQTHLSSDFNLALWPEAFNAQPTAALVAAGVLVAWANLVSLVFSGVNALRNQAHMHTAVSFMAPFVSFVVALVAIAFSYAVNASTSVYTIQSWSCQWDYTKMRLQPHFGTLCKESEAALYLSVILVPVELIIFAIAAMQMRLEREAARLALSRKTGSS
ncbi:hypothetical protein F4861DRAFT_27289 [Xylaria intraflava]|nr:hypothetical protein F4861DRAFT_27289 [Xylaria intraflava]